MNKPVILTNREKMGNLKTILEKSKNSIKAVLPMHMTPDRMIKIALVAASRDPKLLICTPESILRALIQSSELGLEPFTGLQHAYIIPYRNNRNNTMEAEFQPSYRGLIDLARRSGDILSLEAHCVHEKDVFECELGSNPRIKHIPSFGKDRGKVIIVYAIAKIKNGGIQFIPLDVDEIEKIRRSSKAANSGPWVQWWDEMAKKTVVKRLLKYLPASVELTKAITKDAMIDNEDVFDVDSIDIEEIESKSTLEDQSKSDELLNKLENPSAN